MKRVLINGRWPLNLPDHRADRPEWPYWEATRLAAMHHFIEPGDVIYDIGAEAGDFGALFATWGARPVLIEPNPKAWPTIRAVWEMNDLKPFWTVDALIGTEHNGRAAALQGGWPVWSKYEMTEDTGFHYIGQHDDAATTLRHLPTHFAMPMPDIITMDVEGGEGHVLRGATALLEQRKPAVFASLHPQFMKDLYGEDVSEIHTMMKDYGYHGRFLAEDHEQHYVWTHPERRMFPGVAEDYYMPGERIVL